MTFLLSALRNPMYLGNSPESVADLRAQVETLRVQLADASERAEKAERSLDKERAQAVEILRFMKTVLQPKIDELDVAVRLAKLTDKAQKP